MYLDSSSIKLENAIRKSLNLERFEQSYLIPLIAQLSDFLGDTKGGFICNFLSQQITYSLDNLTQIYTYFYGNTMNYDLINQTSIRGFYIKKPKIPILNEDWSSRNKNNFLSEETTKKENTLLLFSYFQQENEQEELFKTVSAIDEVLIKFVEKIEKRFSKLETNDPYYRMISETSRLNTNDYLNLLKLLQYRKSWKAKIWYKSISKLTYNYKSLNLSKSFIKISQSEEYMSMLLLDLLHKN